jgi:thioredoxin-like negative regulator of GroEL
MSCECTLELCYKNESEVEKLHKENPGLFDYAVVDCYTNSDLQTKYEVGFIPVVVILDSSNQEVKRFVREENIFIQLKNYLMKK